MNECVQYAYLLPSSKIDILNSLYKKEGEHRMTGNVEDIIRTGREIRSLLGDARFT